MKQNPPAMSRAAAGEAEIVHDESAGFTIGEVKFIPHTVATGGVMLIDDQPCRLTPIQFAMLELLAQQLCHDATRHESVRGFVSSGVLLGSLPWDTAHPDISHLKQLVRRVRRRLVGSNVALQSRFGLGYRLCTCARPEPGEQVEGALTALIRASVPDV